MEVTGNARVLKEATISAVVIRCGCGDPMGHAAQNLPCPTPAAVEDRGMIAEAVVTAAERTNPFRRIAQAARQGWREGRQ